MAFQESDASHITSIQTLANTSQSHQHPMIYTYNLNVTSLSYPQTFRSNLIQHTAPVTSPRLANHPTSFRHVWKQNGIVTTCNKIFQCPSRAGTITFSYNGNFRIAELPTSSFGEYSSKIRYSAKGVELEYLTQIQDIRKRVVIGRKSEQVTEIGANYTKVRTRKGVDIKFGSSFSSSNVSQYLLDTRTYSHSTNRMSNTEQLKSKLRWVIMTTRTMTMTLLDDLLANTSMIPRERMFVPQIRIVVQRC